MSFSNYLESEKENHVVLLDFIKTYEKINDFKTELEYIK